MLAPVYIAGYTEGSMEAEMAEVKAEMVYQTTEYVTAYRIKSWLDENDIGAMVREIPLQDIFGFGRTSMNSDPMGSEDRVLVNSPDVERATTLIEEIFPSEETE